MRRHTIRAAAVAICLVLAAVLLPIPPASAQAPAQFAFDGVGWGHTVGASQWGMRGQADESRTYDQILTHYYAGTTLGSRTPPSSIRVMLATGLSELRVSGNGTFEFKLGSDVVATATSGGTWSVRSDTGKQFSVFRPDGTKAAGPVGSGTEPLVVSYESHGTIVSLPATDDRYRWGRIEVDALDSSQVRAIAVVSLEQYVRGVNEVPSSWPMEALKAQAVAARTFAAEKAFRTGGNRAVCNCTVFADTRDQVYDGYDKEDPATFGGSTSLASRWPQAVEATANQFVLAGSSLAQTVYHSSSVTSTEANEDVFGGSALSYLRPRDDHWANTPDNPFASWQKTMTQKEVASALGMTQVTSIDLSQRTPGGGVKTAVVQGSTTETFTGERFRSRLGLRSIKVNLAGAGGSTPAPPPSGSTGTVTGVARATDEDGAETPVQGVVVAAEGGQTATTGSDGSYSLGPVPAGQLTVSATVPLGSSSAFAGADAVPCSDPVTGDESVVVDVPAAGTVSQDWSCPEVPDVGGILGGFGGFGGFGFPNLGSLFGLFGGGGFPSFGGFGLGGFGGFDLGSLFASFGLSSFADFNPADFTGDQSQTASPPPDAQ